MALTRPGHIERLPSGSYRVIVYAGTDPLTGRRLRLRQTVKTEGQAQILLGKLLAQVAEGRQPETGVTVAELLRRYMAVAELDSSTRHTYEGYIRRTILPALGSMQLRKVRGPVLDMLYARLHRCGDLACTGKPFTEHSAFPAIDVTPPLGGQYGFRLLLSSAKRSQWASLLLASRCHRPGRGLNATGCP
jgi:integrase